MKNIIKSFFMCLSMFTILPCPYMEWDEKSSRHLMKFYPIIGFIIGVIWTGLYGLLSIVKCPLPLKSALIIIYPFVITGMIHLDGYCDVCDALLSRRDKEEKLRILKDSKIGAFAVGALFILFFLEFGAMLSFLQNNYTEYFIMNSKLKYNEIFKILIQRNSLLWVFIIIPILSRSLAGYFLLNKITIKESHLGSYFKKGTNFMDIWIMIISILLCSLICISVLPFKYIILVFIMIFVSKFMVNKCVKEFGGVSGDVAGFVLVMAECSAYLVLALI